VPPSSMLQMTDTLIMLHLRLMAGTVNSMVMGLMPCSWIEVSQSVRDTHRLSSRLKRKRRQKWGQAERPLHLALLIPDSEECVFL
jgi:hypothetical protein